MDSLVNFVKPFLKEKIRNRIFLHSNIDELYKYVPKSMLPSEYGGDAGPIRDINGNAGFIPKLWSMICNNYFFLYRAMAPEIEIIYAMVQGTREFKSQ